MHGVTDPTAVFLDHGDGRYEPTIAARGPWDPRALHGGAPAALLAGVLETTIAGADRDGATMHPARLTIDLERPVGLVPMTVRSRVVRAGRKVRIAEAELFDDAGNRLARATLLAIRRTPEPLDLSVAVTAPLDPPPPLPEQFVAPGVPGFAHVVDGPMFHADAVEHRFGRGEFGMPGPGADWIRLVLPIVEAEPITALQRVAAAADFGNGVGAALPSGWSFINPDLTVTLHRLPVGEWVCIDATTQLGVIGVGLAESELWDEVGRLGHSIQTLVIEPPG